MAKTKVNAKHTSIARKAFEKVSEQVETWNEFSATVALLVELAEKLGFGIDVRSTHLRKTKPVKKAVKKPHKAKAKKAAPKRKISKAGRENIAKAQRARWAKVHAAQKTKKAEKKAAK